MTDKVREALTDVNAYFEEKYAAGFYDECGYLVDATRQAIAEYNQYIHIRRDAVPDGLINQLKAIDDNDGWIGSKSKEILHKTAALVAEKIEG